MAAKTATVKDLNELAVLGASIKKKIEETVEDLPTREDRLKVRSRRYDVALERFGNYLTVAYRNPERVSPDYRDPQTAIEDAFVFYFGKERMLERDKAELLKQPEGTSPGEKSKIIMAEGRRLTAIVADILACADSLDEQGILCDLPAKLLPPADVLEWDAAKKQMGPRGHARLARLHRTSEGESGANLALQKTLEMIAQEEIKLSDHLRLLSNNRTGNPPEDVEYAEKALVQCKRTRSEAIADRDRHRKIVAGRLELYAVCRQFLHSQGIPITPALLLGTTLPARTGVSEPQKPIAVPAHAPRFYVG